MFCDPGSSSFIDAVLYIIPVVSIEQDEFKLYPVLNDNWLFCTLLFFPPKIKREEEKENEVAKPVF